MMNKDLPGVCEYMKAIVFPNIPDEFTVAEQFRHGLADDEIRRAIAAFREFLYRLYDYLAERKDRIDVETGRDFNPDPCKVSVYMNYMGPIPVCFPVINDMAVILFTIGCYGKLEKKNKLTVTGESLLAPLSKKNEAHNSFFAITKERKQELFGILSDLGFVFESSDFLKTFTVRHDDTHLLFGLKLIAEAQANKKPAAALRR